MTTIKITELTNIGANLASTTVFPVVNMSGTPTTEKTVLGNIANVILSGAGGNYVAVGAATLAGTVTTNAQPNITSTGSLTGLTVSNAASTVNFSNTANVTLGAVGNLHIAGGTAGQLLSTNGNGTLSWASDTTTYGNSNVVSLMASFGSNTITTTGNVSVGNIIGNGRALTSIAGANVSGFVPNANVANTAYAVAAANVSGLGNIASINLTGSNSNVLYGNGVFAPASGGGNANTGNVTFNDINIIGTGNLHLQPDPANANSYLDVFLSSGPDIHIVASANANLILGKDLGANVMTSWDGNTYVQAWDGSNASIWTFGQDGGTIFPTLDVQRGDYPSGTITGQTLLFGDASQEAIISTADGTVSNENSQRLVINPGQGYDYGEGGDIYLWAGRGGDGSGSGGDIKIRGGQGGANTTGGSGGDGGYIRIEAGDSATTGGTPGYIDINAGINYLGAGGYVDIQGGQGHTIGGDAKITGGYGYNERGGNVNIWGGGSGNGQVNEGNVNIQTGGNTWTFDPSGNLTLPGNTFAVNYANGTQVSIGGGGGNTGNVTFNDQIVLGTGSNDGGGGLYLAPGNASIANSAVQYLRVRGGDYPTHIHLDTGNNEYYDQYFGADSRYVKLEANGNIVINADDYNGNSGTWTFDTTGNLTLPGDIIGSANANFTIYSNAAAHEFIFGDDGTFYAPDNVVLGGTSIYIGPGANTLTGIEHEVFIASSNNFAYVQAVVNNVSDNGSADWVALGAKGDDTGGQASLGFTSSGFGDANYSITGNGDGYVFVQSYGPGQTLLGGGGNLVLTTGSQGTTKDIIFGTGGFLSSNIFGRISHANNSLELSRTGATITFPDATEQTTAYINPSVTGNWTLATGNNTVNISVPLNGTYAIWVNGNIPNGIVTYTATAVITNTNVPVLGEQYAWYYAVGNALVLTSIPNQFVGTVGSISNVNTYAGNTANVFTFGITNNSGNTAVVNYGYTKL